MSIKCIAWYDHRPPCAEREADYSAIQAAAKVSGVELVCLESLPDVDISLVANCILLVVHHRQKDFETAVAQYSSLNGRIPVAVISNDPDNIYAWRLESGYGAKLMLILRDAFVSNLDRFLRTWQALYFAHDRAPWLVLHGAMGGRDGIVGRLMPQFLVAAFAYDRALQYSDRLTISGSAVPAPRALAVHLPASVVQASCHSSERAASVCDDAMRLFSSTHQSYIRENLWIETRESGRTLLPFLQWGANLATIRSGQGEIEIADDQRVLVKAIENWWHLVDTLETLHEK